MTIFCLEATSDVNKTLKIMMNSWGLYKLTRRTHYLSWPQSASVDFAKSSFSKQIFFTEWTCCLFHLLECINRWSMQPLRRTRCFIIKLPKLCRFVNPWIVYKSYRLVVQWNSIIKCIKVITLEENEGKENTWICMILRFASSALVPGWDQTEWHD